MSITERLNKLYGKAPELPVTPKRIQDQIQGKVTEENFPPTKHDIYVKDIGDLENRLKLQRRRGHQTGFK
jgi:hypothetical protein